MSAKHNRGSVGVGSGESGAAPAAEAASRVASAVGATPEAVGNKPREPVAAPLPGEEREPVEAPGDGQQPVGAPLPGEEREPEAAPQDDEHEAVLEAEAALEAEAGPEVEDGEDASEPDELDLLTARAEKADEYLALAQRSKADFENYRKRAARDAAAAQERGVIKLARELLPAVDNLDRALAAAESASTPEGGQADNGAATLVSGIKLVHADVMAALARVGIEPFSPRGEAFDPQHHEAVAQQPVDGAEPGTIVEVYQSGYRLGDSVLRPARVVVAG